jgi:hypothetical protein
MTNARVMAIIARAWSPWGYAQSMQHAGHASVYALTLSKPCMRSPELNYSSSSLQCAACQPGEGATRMGLCLSRLMAMPRTHSRTPQRALASEVATMGHGCALPWPHCAIPASPTRKVAPTRMRVWCVSVRRGRACIGVAASRDKTMPCVAPPLACSL